jgi:general secretion pathway protein H
MHRSPGFTLLEALIGMALGAVIIGTSAPRLLDLVDSARLAGAVRTVASTLRMARGRAMAAGVPVEVRFDAALRRVDLRDGARVLATHALPAGVLFTALPARARIRFGGLGTAENGTVTLGAGARIHSVVVNQRGRVRVQ